MEPFEFHHVRLSPAEQIGRHEHPVWEISYIIRGHGRRVMGDLQGDFTAGEVVLVPPDVPHCWQFAPTDQEIENVSVFFTQHWLDEMMSVVSPLKQIFSRISQITDVLLFAGKTQQELQSLFTTMISEDDELRFVSMMRVLALIARSNDSQAIGYMRSEVDDRLQRINVFIKCNYSRDITVNTIARHVGMNRSSLCSFYRRQTGRTLVQTINACRLEAATNLLRHRDLTIQQVCFLCGFREIAYFSRLFKRTFGKTPGSFRKKLDA